MWYTFHTWKAQARHSTSRMRSLYGAINSVRRMNGAQKELLILFILWDVISMKVYFTKTGSSCGARFALLLVSNRIVHLSRRVIMYSFPIFRIYRGILH